MPLYFTPYWFYMRRVSKDLANNEMKEITLSGALHGFWID